MSRIFLTSQLAGTPTADLKPWLQTIFQQLEDQINAGPSIASLTTAQQALPVGMISGDLVFDIRNGELQVGVFNGISVLYASFGSFTGAITDAQHGTRSGGNLHAAATPTLAGFMSNGDKAKLDTYKGVLSGAAAPSLTQFPSPGDWGYYTDTTGPTSYLAVNFAGTIKTTVLA